MFECVDGPLEDIDVSDWEAPDWLDELPLDEDWLEPDPLTDAAAGPVGVVHLVNLLRVDPAALAADDAVTFAREVDRLVAFASGIQAKARAGVMRRLVAHAEGSPATAKPLFVTPEMLASAELAAALRVAPRSMDAQLDLAADLAGPMSALRDALLAGELSPAHVSAIARELNRAPMTNDPAKADEFAALCQRVLAVVLPYAADHTAGACARRVRMLLVTLIPTTAAERKREAAEREHGVWLTPTDNGSCELTAVMPIAHGQAVFDAITRLAGSEQFQTGEGCVTAGQRRVAALSTLVLGDPGRVARMDGPVAEAKVTARVNVLVPLTTLLDPSPCVQGGTVGGEPVTAAVILDLLADANAASTLRRLVTDRDGCMVDAGRTRYAISDTQRHLITLRDRTCRFPGCTRNATACEIDHAIAWDDGGSTDLANLGALCKHHHQLKTHGGWRITSSDRSGACTWRSPLGRIYEHRPPPLAPPETDHELETGNAMARDTEPIYGPTPF